MDSVKNYLQAFLLQKQLMIPNRHNQLFEAFVQDEANFKAVEQILANQQMLMEKWKIKDRVDTIIRQHAVLPNATVGKPYEAVLDFEKWQWGDITAFELDNLEAIGLQIDKASRLITGIPTQSGDIRLVFKFRIQGETDDSLLNEKAFPFIVNPDPKSLWKDIPPPSDAPFMKPLEQAVQAQLGSHTLVAASKRGRSHANAGTFRDDDFAYTYIAQTGWNVVAVADGAGSAVFSREGSRIACETVIDYFATNLQAVKAQSFDVLLQANHQQPTEELQKKISHEVYQLLSGAAFEAHKAIEQTAMSTQATLKDFHTTLAFVAFKKYPFGYSILSFSVGDCPMALLSKDHSNVTLLNKLDVGEFSGGTRFLTMQEIFTSSESLQKRCGFKTVEDFSYIVLMTDGIYDAKFGVEASLEKAENWQQLLNDLAGQNDDGLAVQLDAANTDAGKQLLAWMDFWSAGNHDDRTIALVF
jgi:serine/threonine protein phosphatase PrpC